MTYSALLFAAISAGIIHTAAGPDHYLPFAALAKEKNYSFLKTLILTVCCGIGHLAGAFIIGLAAAEFLGLLEEHNILQIESIRGDLAAYLLIGGGLALIIYSIHHRLKKHHHHHENGKTMNWVLFIIFVLGPCEALLPILTAAAALGAGAVITASLVFSLATLLTMSILALAFSGVFKAVKWHFLEKYSGELAGGIIALCGVAICCGL